MRVAGQGRRWRVTIAAVAVTAVIAIVSGCPTGLGDHTGTDPETNPVTYTVSYDANGAWGQDFSDGLDVYFDKNLDFNVRAVRAF